MRATALTMALTIGACASTAVSPAVGSAGGDEAASTSSAPAPDPPRDEGTDVPVSEDAEESSTSIGPVAEDVLPRTIPSTDGRPFGCQPLGVLEGRLLRRLPAADLPYEPGGAVAASHARDLRPRLGSVRVLGPEGACEPNLGSATFLFETGADAIVGETIGGCGRALAALALADCEVPGWLRRLGLTAHIDHLPRRGVLDDPMLEALASGDPDFIVATDTETTAQRRARLRRRYRSSTVRTEREELLVLELHRYLDGAHPCEYAEDVRTSVHVRRVDRDPPGPWETLHPSGRVVGAYVDENGLVVGLDTVQSPPEGGCEVGPRHMLTCDLLALEARSGETLATASIGYGMNATFRGATSLVAHARDCRESGY